MDSNFLDIDVIFFFFSHSIVEFAQGLVGGDNSPPSPPTVQYRPGGLKSGYHLLIQPKKYCDSTGTGPRKLL